MKSITTPTTLLLVLISSAFGQTRGSDGRELAVSQDGYFNLQVDPWDPQGFRDEWLGDPALPGNDKIVVSFPFKMKLTMYFVDSKSKVKYQRSAWLKPNEPIVGNVVKKNFNEKTQKWELLCEAWLAKTCSNPFPKPFQFVAEISAITKAPTRLEKVAIVKPETLDIPRDVYVREEIPTPRDISVSIPERERPGYQLILGEKLEATKFWRYSKDLWDHILGFLNATSYPIGQIFRKADRFSIVALGGNATGGSASSESSSAASAAASASAAAAAAAGGGGPEEPLLVAFIHRLLDLSNTVLDRPRLIAAL